MDLIFQTQNQSWHPNQKFKQEHSSHQTTHELEKNRYRTENRDTTNTSNISHHNQIKWNTTYEYVQLKLLLESTENNQQVVKKDIKHHEKFQ